MISAVIRTAFSGIVLVSLAIQAMLHSFLGSNEGGP
jgi:hypothetical protein